MFRIGRFIEIESGLVVSGYRKLGETGKIRENKYRIFFCRNKNFLKG